MKWNDIEDWMFVLFTLACVVAACSIALVSVAASGRIFGWW